MNEPLNAPELKLLDHVSFGVCLVDSDYRIVLWNQVLEQWTGQKRAQMLGTSLVKRYPHLEQVRYLKRLDSILAGGPPAVFSCQLHPHFIEAPLPDGA